MRHGVPHGRRPDHADHAASHRHTGAFADARLYFPEGDIWDLENSGQHATWFAARTEDPDENLSKVHLYPQDFYFPSAGQPFITSPHQGSNPCPPLPSRWPVPDAATQGRFEADDAEKNQMLMHQSTYVWPHAFTRMDAPADVFLSSSGRTTSTQSLVTSQQNRHPSAGSWRSTSSGSTERPAARSHGGPNDLSTGYRLGARPGWE